MEIKIVLEAGKSLELLVDKVVEAISSITTPKLTGNFLKTEEPATTTTKPVVTTTKPVVTTTKPVVTTTKPATTVTKPAATVEKPAAIVEKPSAPVKEDSSDVSLQSLRSLLREKMNVGDNREQIRAKLVNLGANNLTTLEVKHYDEMFAFLREL